MRAAAALLAPVVLCAPAACSANAPAPAQSPVERRVIEIVSEHLGLAPGKVTATSSFTELGADSLDFVELIMAFEEEYAISIPDDAAEQLCSVDKAVEYIAKTKA